MYILVYIFYNLFSIQTPAFFFKKGTMYVFWINCMNGVLNFFSYVFGFSEIKS